MPPDCAGDWPPTQSRIENHSQGSRQQLNTRFYFNSSFLRTSCFDSKTAIGEFVVRFRAFTNSSWKNAPHYNQCQLACVPPGSACSIWHTCTKNSNWSHNCKNKQPDHPLQWSFQLQPSMNKVIKCLVSLKRSLEIRIGTHHIMQYVGDDQDVHHRCQWKQTSSL